MSLCKNKSIIYIKGKCKTFQEAFKKIKWQSEYMDRMREKLEEAISDLEKLKNE